MLSQHVGGAESAQRGFLGAAFNGGVMVDTWRVPLPDGRVLTLAQFQTLVIETRTAETKAQAELLVIAQQLLDEESK